MWWQKTLSEAQQVEKIRKVRLQFLRWQKPLWIALILLFLLWLAAMVDFAARPTQIVSQMQSISRHQFVLGYFVGGLLAFALGLFLGVVFALLLLCSTETKSWDLMLKYHDRLRQAGLLPMEQADKMETVDPPSGS